MSVLKSSYERRPYRLGKRADAVALTRKRIVAAARRAYTGSGSRTASLEEVARLAGVSRATIYHNYGSWLGLLEAVIIDSEERAGQECILEALATGDAVEATRTTFEAGSRFWAADDVLARKVSALAALDPGVGELVAARSRGRLALVGELADRLSHQHRLRPGCSVERATDILFLMSSFEAFDLLFTGRGVPADAVAAVQLQLIEDTVIRPPQP